MLGNGGRITGISYNPKTKEFNISYVSVSNVSYIGKITPAGKIEQLERSMTSIEYTDLWVNYYESEGKFVYSIIRDDNATNSWDISKPIYKFTDVPWRNSAIYKNIVSVEVEEDIIPESTKYMFYQLENAVTIQGLDELLTRVNIIGEYMFYCCKSLQSISIPTSITRIEEDAFCTCKALTDLEIPKSVTTIGVNAFNACNGLVSITIPGSVTTMGDYVFSSCDGLNSAIIENGVIKLANDMFLNCVNLKTVKLPNSLQAISSRAFCGCGLKNITIPDSVTDIGVQAFRGCNKLTDIIIPDNVINIGSGTFWWCSNLGSVSIGSGVTNIANDIFSNCSKLTTITIKKEEDSVEGKPWGAPNGVGIVTWSP